MKYWTGYITAAILAAIAWALNQMGERFTVLVDMVYPYVTRTLQTMLAEWSGSLDFLLWQLIAVALVVIAIAFLVVIIIMRWNPIRWLGWVLAGCSFIYMLHTLVFGLNYYAGSIADDVRLEMDDYIVEDLIDATKYYRNIANALAVQMDRDETGSVDFSDFDTLAQQAGDGFRNLVYRDSYSVFAGSTAPVKKLGWADMYTSMGITGFTMGLTGEAAVNPQIPDVTLPFTMCHEMAHRMCIATEGDANFAAFLACQANSSLEFQYSAYFMAYRYCYNALVSANTTTAVTAAAQIVEEVSPQLQADMDHYSAFFASKQDEQATKLADTVNDTYLKTSGDKDGIASYGNVVDLLVNWHFQKIVLPSITVEEDPFDPLDESQVDLSGIVNAKEPVATEPPENEGGGVG